MPSLAITFFAIAGLFWLRVDVTFESFLEQDDPVLLAYEKFADTFGRDERIVISADPGTASGPAGVFERRFLERLRDFHRALEERVPHVEKLTGLVNARDARAEGDTLIVDVEPGDLRPARHIDDRVRIRLRGLARTGAALAGGSLERARRSPLAADPGRYTRTQAVLTGAFAAGLAGGPADAG